MTKSNELLAKLRYFKSVGQPQNRILCFELDSPGIGNASGFVIHPTEPVIYLSVPKKYLPADPGKMQVFVWDPPDHLVIEGELHPAFSLEDSKNTFEGFLSHGWSEANAKYAVYDQRTHKPRKHWHKLSIRRLILQKDTQ
jgi:hypothetical protein